MRQTGLLVLMAIMISHVISAPQFITFKDGKLGVNFGGYHAGVGLGGLLGSGAEGGLFAEAGTPHGQSARAGLGGVVDGNGRTAGGLYAGATAGGNVKAAAGLAGGVEAGKSEGGGFATAQSGNHYALSGLGGESAVGGSGGFSYSGTKTFEVPTTIIKETKVSVQPVDTAKPIYKKVHNEIDLDSVNEINSIPLTSAHSAVYKAEIGGNVNIQTDVQPSTVVKEVIIEEQPQVIEKHIVHTPNKGHGHHFHKTAYIGGYVGSDNLAPSPKIDKRIDVDAESAVNAEAGVAVNANTHKGGAGQVTYTKQVTVGRNPQFFADIFNIPISTLKAVSDFLGGVAGGTSISVQKAASVQAGGYY